LNPGAASFRPGTGRVESKRPEVEEDTTMEDGEEREEGEE